MLQSRFITIAVILVAKYAQQYQMIASLRYEQIRRRGTYPEPPLTQRPKQMLARSCEFLHPASSLHIFDEKTGLCSVQKIVPELGGKNAERHVW
mmetsp:Transcript_5859/g.14141  ORF Transcript_5859/g.14141 Transcript_5859/m.14141 type:complete len:94 (-) Transcript_5859:1437-1718(-)